MSREDVKRQVQQATDLVRLIGEQISLRPRGREFLGLCPFHDDSNPSLHVSAAKQIYKCFACGAGGDCFSFVMDYHKMSFPEALQHLADRAGIQLPKFRSDETGGESDNTRDRLRKANNQAQRFFGRQLADEQAGKTAREYLAERGISEEMIRAFGIGYAPDEWEAMSAGIAKQKMDADAFVKAGLICDRGDGTRFDRFRHRLMFPIFDALGRPIGFGGRVLPGGTLEDKSTDAKYLNSPETMLFNKSATLFGLHLAKKPIINSRVAVIVEGYTDVIAAHQAGFANVVATLGTALTRQHAVELRRYADKVVLVFDADEAGQKAAERALEVFFNEPLDVAIAVLPDGLDPADLLMQPEGAERWRAAVENASDAMTFHFARVRAGFDKLDTIAGRQRLAEDYLRRLVQLGLRQTDALRRGMVIGHVAELLKLDAATVERTIRLIGGGPRGIGLAEARPAGATPENTQTTSVNRPRDARTEVERLIVGCLLNQPDFFHESMSDGRQLAEAVGAGDLADELTRGVYEQVHHWLAEHEENSGLELRNILADEKLLRHALDLKFEVDRLCAEDAGTMLSRLKAAVRRLDDIRAENVYQQQKLTSVAEPTEGGDVIQTRLAQAIEHARTHPSSARTPRVGASAK